MRLSQTPIRGTVTPRHDRTIERRVPGKQPPHQRFLATRQGVNHPPAPTGIGIPICLEQIARMPTDLLREYGHFGVSFLVVDHSNARHTPPQWVPYQRVLRPSGWHVATGHATTKGHHGSIWQTVAQSSLRTTSSLHGQLSSSAWMRTNRRPVFHEQVAFRHAVRRGRNGCAISPDSLFSWWSLILGTRPHTANPYKSVYTMYRFPPKVPTS
jgi:hypothetical protein